MGKVPLPDSLPGDFFVVQYEEDMEQYKLFLDDGRGSSFLVGNVQDAMTVLSVWGVDRLLAGRALDYAREFKAPVQCIPSEGRTISFRNRKDERKLVFAEEQPAGWVHSV